MDQNKQPNGSGVLLWEIFKSEIDGRVGLAVILFGSMRKSGFVYSDCGGGIGQSEQVVVGALRELQEESCNLFQFQQKHLTTYVQTKQYVCYNIFLNSLQKDIRQKVFKENLQILKNANCPHSWRETKSIKRFFIDDLIKLNIQSNQDFNFTGITTKGEHVNIQLRCVNVIKQVLSQNLVNLKEQTISVPSFQVSLKAFNLPNGSKLTFLQGTKTFQIDQAFMDIENSIKYQKQIQNSYDQQIQQNSNQIQMQPQNNIEKPFQDILLKYEITNKTLISKIQDPKNNRRGGGILILATSENREQGLLLVKDTKDICSDMGGSSSPHEIDIKEAGIRELKEESSNTFILNDINLSNEHSIRIQNYLCSAVHIEVNIPHLQQVFQNNVQILSSLGQHVPKCWRNKKEIIFFPISINIPNFQQFDINADSYYLIDSKGNKCQIRDRTAIIIHQFITSQMYLFLPIQKIVLKDNSKNEFLYNEEFKFLLNTQSYVFV
ncbi:hypothetical protein ABPG74_022457 [Tetrahymena malaccensis]